MTIGSHYRQCLALCVSLLVMLPAFGSTPADRIGFEPPLGARIPGSILLSDRRDRQRTLGEWISGQPAVLLPMYFDCPNLCELTASGLDRALREMGPEAAPRYNVLAISIDPRERAEGLLEARAELAEHGAQVSKWKVLRGDVANIRALTRAIGFRYFYDERTEQFAHAAGIVVVDATGRMTHYFPGVSYSGKELWAALRDAERSRVGRVTHRLLLTCFDYDPSTGEYSMRVVSTLRWAGIGCALLLALSIGIALHRDRLRTGARLERR